MQILHIQLSNLHCGDCEDAIHRSLAKFDFIKLINPDSQTSPQYHAENDPDFTFYEIKDMKEIIFYHDDSDLGSNVDVPSILHHYLKKLIKAISKNGFQVISWELVENGQVKLQSQDLKNAPDSKHVTQESHGILNAWSKYRHHKNEQQHMKYCHQCATSHKPNQKKGLFSGSTSPKNLSEESFNDSVQTHVARPSQEYRAVFLVSGMTCASCVGSVLESIQNILEQENASIKNEDDETNYSINLLQHSAVVIIPNKQLVNKIISAVESSGFECRLLEILPVERSVNVKVTAIIGGMTCAACSNSIQTAVNELPFVLECGINVLTKSGTFVMEESVTDHKNYLTELQETVENCGFDIEVISVDKINYTSGKKSSRSINVKVEGMFCGHCPEILTNYLNSFGEAVVIEDTITLEHPFIKFTYIPNQEKNITIRRFLNDLNHLKATDEEPGYRVIDENEEGTFKCTLIRSVSMDEHLRKLTKKETSRVIRKLTIATLFAIPTFIFGVVAMSLLPKSNNFRMWVEEPLWVGNVSRNTWILFFLATPVYFCAADIFHVKAIKELLSLWVHKATWNKRLFRFGSMNLLVSLGTSVSYFASIALLILAAHQEPQHGLETTYFDSVVFLSFFLLIGRVLEMVSKAKTADSIAGLGDLKVHQASLVESVKKETDGSAKYENVKLIETRFLEADDLIVIASGESPPVDCIVVEGSSEFDESALTGESTPVKHVPGHQIFSGTVNVGNNSIIAKIISLEGDSLIDQIVSTVRDGQLRKAPIARTADALTGYFVPVIVLLAIITFVVWLALAYSGALPDDYLDVDIGGWAVWSLEFAIAVFVIACPCGLGLAAPTALFVGSGLAAKYGILAKGGGVAFQDGANTNVVCFDKTGTLTYGELKVTDIAFVVKNLETADKQYAAKLFGLQIARDLEISSKHPISKAVRDFIETHKDYSDTSLKPTQNKIPQVENIPGKGLKGDINIDQSSGEAWNNFHPSDALLGNEALMKDYGVEITEQQAELLNTWKKQCKSVILVATRCAQLFEDDSFHLVLLMACRDQIRRETKLVIDYLHDKLGIQCWMITGDNKLTADAIGGEIGIPSNQIISEVLPDEKQSRVKMIQRLNKKNVVAMVGDGINDAPALSTADVGIALASGADLALTSSDFILLNKSHPLVTLVTLFNLSQVVFRRVKFNFCWSLVYNCVGIPIAAGVIYPYKNSRLNPVWASAAMALSSVSVVTSSLALKLYRPKIKAEQLAKIEREEATQTETPVTESSV